MASNKMSHHIPQVCYWSLNIKITINITIKEKRNSDGWGFTHSTTLTLKILSENISCVTEINIREC